MKKHLRTMAVLLCCTATELVFGQSTSNNYTATVVPQVVAAKVRDVKTLTSMDLLSNLYQIAANDLTADSKSIKFKSTIFGLEKVFDPNVANARTYAQKWLERYLEPYVTFGYKNKFDPSNLTLGANFSFINANDKTSSPVFNRYNSHIMSEITALDVKIDAYILSLNTRMQPRDVTQGPIMANAIDQLTDQLVQFVRTGDDSHLSSQMKADLNASGALGDIKNLHDEIDALALKISNRWNVVFSPQLTYAFNRSAVQGASFMFNAVKGFEILPKRSTQLTLKGGYVLGDDTIIRKTATGRTQFASQFGFNQVLFTKALIATDGTSSNVPCTELAISYGLNYLTSGYGAKEQRRQESLNAKFGLLIGKNSWLVVPFTYNYATKTTYASISVKVNLGDAPFTSTR